MRPGSPFPLGASVVAGGVNFAVFSEHAHAVDLCLFDADGRETRHRLPARTDGVWHGELSGVLPGQRYGYRVHGPWQLGRGHCFNPNKLVIDPYARAFAGTTDYSGPLRVDDAEAHPDARDSAPFVPRSVVVGDDPFDWQGDAPPRVPWADTVVYETHVKGFTRRHPEVPPELRGTYGGLGSPAPIAHLRALGVTTVQLMPVHQVMDELSLAQRGKKNYWGYSTLGFFAPDTRFAASAERVRDEFKGMVRALHAAGIEVLLDVVYNHTCEGGMDGPAVSFRGLDNLVYYRHDPKKPGKYLDYTGCGNSVDLGHPAVLRLVADSLRYWVTEMHVDGFRFDLAPALGREGGGFDPGAAFFDIVHQDPVLSRVKLVAEPWDLAPDGYQLGRFPRSWREHDGKFRDWARRFWNGYGRGFGEAGYRLSGSSDLFEGGGRGPDAGINFVTAHDGFTLRDLVSYDRKHNEANGENNRDGWDDNASRNFGVEGESDHPAVRDARARQVRALFATLLLVPGVPMILAGDELRRTQHGNNNAYCIDDESTWVDWELDDEARELLAYVRGLLAVRRELPALRSTRFYRGKPFEPAEGHAPPSTRSGARRKDLTWLRADGGEMKARDWSAQATRTLGALYADRDDTLALLLLNGEEEAVSFKLPRREPTFHVVVDSRGAAVPFGGTASGVYEMAPRSLVLLTSPRHT